MEIDNEKGSWVLSMGFFSTILLCVLFGICLLGCGSMSGYSNQPLFRQEVGSIYIEMFDNQSFWRGVEYELTDALSKRIETHTPYKIISHRDKADTVISGQLTSISKSVLVTERQTGRPLENEIFLHAVVNWKNLKTGELLIDNQTVIASASYSEWQRQGSDYASSVAANNLAERIVELMEKKW